MNRKCEGKLLQVVVPCYNEAAIIKQTHEHLSRVLSGLSCHYHIIYINDGSWDGTHVLLNEIANNDHVSVIHFSRNFGHQVAVTAGLDYADADMVVIIDADLQDPPEVITDMIDQWQTGYDVVYGKRLARDGETLFKKVTAKCFYRLLKTMTKDLDIPLDTGDFRLIDRKVLKAVKAMPERDRFLRGMFAWLGFQQAPVFYHRRSRAAGETKYTFKKMIAFALDAMLSFSSFPLRMMSWLGLVMTFLAIIGVVYTLSIRVFTHNWVPGWAFIMIVVLLAAGVQMMMLGVIGEYIGRSYRELKNRPLYVIDEIRGK